MPHIHVSPINWRGTLFSVSKSLVFSLRATISYLSDKLSSSKGMFCTCLKSCSVGKRPLSRRQFPPSLSEEIMKQRSAACCIQRADYFCVYFAVCVHKCRCRYTPVSVLCSDRARQQKRDWSSWALSLYWTPSLAINGLTIDMIIAIDADLPDFKIILSGSWACHYRSKRDWVDCLGCEPDCLTGVSQTSLFCCSWLIYIPSGHMCSVQYWVTV